MKFQPHSIYHVYNQGNNQQQLFFSDEDYVYFLQLYETYIHPYVDTIAWRLLPNHFHLMVSVKESCVEVKQGSLLMDSVSNGFRKLLSAFAHRFNSETKKPALFLVQKQKQRSLIPGAI